MVHIKCEGMSKSFCHSKQRDKKAVEKETITVHEEGMKSETQRLVSPYSEDPKHARIWGNTRIHTACWSVYPLICAWQRGRAAKGLCCSRAHARQPGLLEGCSLCAA